MTRLFLLRLVVLLAVVFLLWTLAEVPRSYRLEVVMFLALGLALGLLLPLLKLSGF